MDNHAAKRVLASLKNVCRPDLNFYHGRVNSIYFDTHDWVFAMEKASSDYLKSKVRIRWYNYTQQNQARTSTCFLELKRKIGSKREKVRKPFDVDPQNIAYLLKSPARIDAVQQFLHRYAPEFAGYDLKPKFRISYTRHRFVEPITNTRIALDTNIEAKIVSSDSEYHRSIIKLDRTVLEVKGHEDELPIALRYLDAPNIHKEAFSKYFLCFQALTHYEQ